MSRAAPSICAENAGSDEIGAILERAAAEVELLRIKSARLEQSVCASTPKDEMTADLVEDMQEFDFLMQHLAGLRDFLAVLSSLSDESWRLDPTMALNTVAVAALKLRLSGDATAESGADAGGEMEFF